ncbi:MAG: carboxypeptidase-like regulatory domain-containing protein [Planctomycetota bacterium]|nr:carboxypeptidase-like regulatory domain-containing protein [Planctomycetota bacterium]
MGFRSIRSGGCFLLSIVILLGSPVLASQAVRFRTSDYLLGQNGILEGNVVNESGRPAVGLPVRVLHDGHVIAKAISDEKGHFAVESLRTGEHTVQLGASLQPVRFWDNAAAPPATLSRSLLMKKSSVARMVTRPTVVSSDQTCCLW